MKIKIRAEDWIGFYSELAGELTEEFSLDGVWDEDEFGNQILTESGQNNYIHIVGIVEEHMERYFEKVDIRITPEQGIANVCAEISEGKAIDDEHVGAAVSQAEVDTLLSTKTGGMFSDGAVSMDSYGANDD
tara:strand:- start:1142 stop:1537 length:396 start_codon:yes stop_codon:yes gene_type:complete